MTDDDEHRWHDGDTPPRGPSAPPDLRFDPFATALGVFLGVAIPIVVIGYTRPSGSNATIIVVGIIVGLLAGVLAGIWVAHRGGRVWRGRQL